MLFHRETSVIVETDWFLFLFWATDRIVGVDDVEAIMLVNRVVKNQIEVDFFQVVDVLNSEGIAIGLQGMVAFR